MNLNYTKLAILLLRVSGITIVAHSISGIAMSIPALLRFSEYTEAGIPNYALSVVLQPAVGALLIALSVPLARKFVSFLDEEK